MSIRFDDAQRTVSLSVRDLAADGATSGHLALSVIRSQRARAEAGRRVHREWQSERADDSDSYRAEMVVRRVLPVGEWTATLLGRIDGVDAGSERTVVEEIKSTPLDASRLFATRASDWPAWLAQLEIYLWMLAAEEVGRPPPVGRLVLVSLADASRHVIGVPLEAERIGARVQAQLEGIVEARERRNARMAVRRASPVPMPHDGWRPGQQRIVETLEAGLEEGRSVLIQAPTGLGKTDAAMVGVLRLALRTDRQVFWATARTTQQRGVIRALGRLAGAGLPLRAVQLGARDRMCLNTVVDCRPDACTYADGYFDRLKETGIVRNVSDGCTAVGTSRLRGLGQQHRLCAFELGLALVDEADVVIGDYNYALDPAVRLPQLEEQGQGWIVVADEVHQLVDRARGWVSPMVDAAVARQARHQLASGGRAFSTFARLAERIEAWVVAVSRGPALRRARDQAVIELPGDELAELAEAVDGVGIDYALLRAERQLGERQTALLQSSPRFGDDAWIELARQVIRLAEVLAGERDEYTVAVAQTAPQQERVGLLCLDPSRALGARLGRLAGFVGLSATLRPPEFHRDLLGLPPERTVLVDVPSPFPPEHRRVLVAPRVSTAFRDRDLHAQPTADLLEECLAAVPGNAAVYFPSFAMLDDIVGRMRRDGREWLVQRPGMDEALRTSAIDRLSAPGLPKVLCAVLGGVFAEGIDLPPGALRAVLVVGPALPPVGLERDLLREHYETRFGDGFRFASLVPGLTRVVQAAGRLIRRPQDQGVVVLVDRRFRWRDVAALLPGEWAPAVAHDPAEEIRRFFGVQPPCEAEVG